MHCVSTDYEDKIGKIAKGKLFIVQDKDFTLFPSP